MTRPPRTHCVHGHELAVVGVYETMARQYNGKYRLERRCKACKLAYDRRPRPAAPTPFVPDNPAVNARVLDILVRAESAMPWEREELLERARLLQESNKPRRRSDQHNQP